MGSFFFFKFINISSQKRWAVKIGNHECELVGNLWTEQIFNFLKANTGVLFQKID